MKSRCTQLQQRAHEADTNSNNNKPSWLPLSTDVHVCSVGREVSTVSSLHIFSLWHCDMDWGHSLLEEFLHSPTHTPPLPPPPLSQQLCFLFDLLMFSWKAETLQTETRLRAERDSHTSSYLFFFSFFFSCHLIDLITWSILLNNVSHLVPLFWDLSINCLLRDLRGEALFAFNERGRSSQNIHYSIGGMNYGTGLQRASYRKHLIRLSNIYHQMHVWPRSQWRPL